MNIPVTPKQKEVLDFIKAYIRVNGVSPTLREMSDELGKCRVTVWEHINALIKRGALEKTSNQARSVVPVEFTQCPNCGEQIELGEGGGEDDDGTN